MKLRLIIYCMLLSGCIPTAFAAKVFKTEVFSPAIKTLNVGIANSWGLFPCIELEGGQQIEISFDEIAEKPVRYIYTLTHCNADWTPSSLVQSEFMSGFQNQQIYDYEHSFNTTMDYLNYKIFLPNEDLTMKVSGNYVVQVYKEDEPNKVVLSACFSVLESDVSIDMKVTSNTDIDFNKTHQQLSFDINYSDDSFVPAQELKVYAMQNSRRDNAQQVEPLTVQSRKLVYDHNKKLIFDAGNEYRRFEMISTRYNGMGMEQIEFHAPYFHVTLFPAQLRSNKTYSYDQDQNGRFYVRNGDASEYDIESDYFFVHFSLPCEKPFAEDVYILSEAFSNVLDERSKMEYNFELKSYERTELLKQGLYNFMYVTKKSGASTGSTTLIEGNYFQTENEYQVLVYRRPFGSRYDKLIGFQQILGKDAVRNF